MPGVTLDKVGPPARSKPRPYAKKYEGSKAQGEDGISHGIGASGSKAGRRRKKNGNKGSVWGGGCGVRMRAPLLPPRKNCLAACQQV